MSNNNINKEMQGLVNETSVAYQPDQLLRPKDFFTDKLLITHMIRTGVPYSLFREVQKLAPFSDHNWADILEISTKSLQRYEKEERRFKRIHSEKIIQIAEICILGLDVFGNSEKLRLWLDTPSYALGNIRPSEFLKDSYGVELLSGELNRIDHGIFV
ncbi:MAG: antitoxin Xre/MbcA/ParS toxin-binding domain-containing protein [Balneolales bacterium]